MLFVLNPLIACRTFKDNSKRLLNSKKIKNRQKLLNSQHSQKEVRDHEATTIRHFSRKPTIKMTRTLLILSFSYAILNVPYFISWWNLYTQPVQDQLDQIAKKQLFTAIKIDSTSKCTQLLTSVLFVLLVGQFVSSSA